MKKYVLLTLLAAFFGCVSVHAADYADILKRLDSDYSQSLTAETNVSWLGTTGNPNGNLDVFKARDEIRALMNEAFGDAAKTAELKAFFVDALQKDIRPTTRVWILEQLAGIGTCSEVPAIAAQLDSKDRTVVDAAAAALALMKCPKALEALESKKDLPACQAALAQKKEPIPAWMPVEAQLPLGLSNAADSVVDQWMANYAQLDEMTKAQTIAALAARKAVKYRGVVIEALNSESEILKKAAFLALEKLAAKEDVDILLAKAAEDRALVIRLCGFIVADGFDEALKARLVKAENVEEALLLATILTDRAVDIRAEIFAKTTAPECANRLVLLQQIAKITTPADVEPLVASTLRFPLGGERDAAENIIAACCAGDAAPIIALKGKFALTDLFSIIGRTGGDAAMAEVNAGLTSSDAAVKNAAIRALSVWPNAKFADKMFAVATDGAYSDDQKVAALRSFIRVISLPDDKIGIGISKDGKLEKLQEAFKVAVRADEKRLILSRLAANRTAKSLKFAVECAADPELAEAAYAAIADHAHDNVLRQSNMDVFGPAMDLVIEKSTNQGLVDRVKKYKTQK